MSDDEEYVPVPRNERSRKYIPLGNGSSQRKPKTHPDSSPQINSLGISGITNVTSSFCVDQPPRQVCKIPPPLPDIYTTCPELRTFKLAISLESIPKFNSIKPNLEGGTFDPNKKILKPFVSSNVIDFFLFLIFPSPFCFFRCSNQIDLPQALLQLLSNVSNALFFDFVKLFKCLFYVFLVFIFIVNCTSAL